MFFGEGESVRRELLKHLHSEYYRLSREVAPTTSATKASRTPLSG